MLSPPRTRATRTRWVPGRKAASATLPADGAVGRRRPRAVKTAARPPSTTSSVARRSTIRGPCGLRIRRVVLRQARDRVRRPHPITFRDRRQGRSPGPAATRGTALGRRQQAVARPSPRRRGSRCGRRTRSACPSAVPVQRGDRTLRAARVSSGRRRPARARRARSLASRRRSARTATSSPRGTRPSSRFFPSASTTQTPSAAATSSRPPSGQREQRGLGALDPDGLADAIDDCLPRRAGDGEPDARRHRAARDATKRRRGAARNAARARRYAASTTRVRALPRDVRARHDDTFERVSHSRSRIASSPRRSRELTVPRGRSSARAISPGV